MTITGTGMTVTGTGITLMIIHPSFIVCFTNPENPLVKREKPHSSQQLLLQFAG